MKTKPRNYKLDNIKTLLIFCVVLSHFIELFIERRLTPVSLLYTVIHLFCMPLFMFVTGYFAKNSPRRTLKQLLWPYLLFQTLYLLFDAFFISDTRELALQYTTPYWLLWFLVAAAVYQLVMPLLDTDKRWLQITEILGSVVISLLVGMDDSIGYYLSLSRVFTFAPYYLLGHYSKKNDEMIAELFRKRPKLKYISPAIFAGLAVFSTLFIVLFEAVDHVPYAYFGSYSYHAGGYTASMKFGLLLVALGIGALYVAFIPNKKLPGVTSVGKNTLPIYLLHGFVVRLADKFQLLHYSSMVNLLISALAAVALIALLGNRWFAKAFLFLLTGQWFVALTALIKKYHERKQA